MKRIEVIERLKQGDTIIFDSSPRTFGTIFKSNGRSMRYDTVLNLIKEGLVNREYSKTAHGISYITWKECPLCGGTKEVIERPPRLMGATYPENDPYKGDEHLEPCPLCEQKQRSEAEHEQGIG